MKKGQDNLRIALRDNLNMNFYKVHGNGGIPNLHYIGEGDFPSGWMEIIHLDDWGKRVSSGLRLEQAQWVHDYIERGGSAWIVIRIEGSVPLLGWICLRHTRQTKSQEVYGSRHMEKEW